jgi:hypothetical protein
MSPRRAAIMPRALSTGRSSRRYERLTQPERRQEIHPRQLTHHPSSSAHPPPAQRCPCNALSGPRTRRRLRSRTRTTPECRRCGVTLQRLKDEGGRIKRRSSAFIPHPSSFKSGRSTHQAHAHTNELCSGATAALVRPPRPFGEASEAIGDSASTYFCGEQRRA